jgi:hypothetical protein
MRSIKPARLGREVLGVKTMVSWIGSELGDRVPAGHQYLRRGDGSRGCFAGDWGLLSEKLKVKSEKLKVKSLLLAFDGSTGGIAVQEGADAVLEALSWLLLVHFGLSV